MAGMTISPKGRWVLERILAIDREAFADERGIFELIASIDPVSADIGERRRKAFKQAVTEATIEFASHSQWMEMNAQHDI